MIESRALQRLDVSLEVTDRMIEEISKEQLAEVSRMLAVQVSHYQRRFGVLSVEDSLSLLNAACISEEEAGWISDGLENLAAVISIATEEGKREPLDNWNVDG